MIQSENIFSNFPEISYKIDNESHTNKGLWIACTIISIWAISLVILLSIDISKISRLWLWIAGIWQMFLYTGLFITAHDAMHGVVFPKNPKINDFIGSLTLLLYGLFSYQELRNKHKLHHQYPASELDPDFHDYQHKNFFSWYFYFMKRYWSWFRLFALILIFRLLNYILHIPEDNLNFFWVIPSIASSVQLFYFGTFLPHREPVGGYTNSHRAQSTPFPNFLSFITCYYFGYHQEHHEHLDLPWWKLSEAYKMRQKIYK